MKVTIEISLGTVNFKDKETGEAKTMEKVICKLPSGRTFEVTSNRFTYRAFDDLLEMLKNQGGDNA